VRVGAHVGSGASLVGPICKNNRDMVESIVLESRLGNVTFLAGRSPHIPE
jgi:hypothetical protein